VVIDGGCTHYVDLKMQVRGHRGGFIPGGDQLPARRPALLAYGYNGLAATKEEDPDNPGPVVSAWWDDADAPCSCRVVLRASEMSSASERLPGGSIRSASSCGTGPGTCG
jgi:hypothetical protein